MSLIVCASRKLTLHRHAIVYFCVIVDIARLPHCDVQEVVSKIPGDSAQRESDGKVLDIFKFEVEIRKINGCS